MDLIALDIGNSSVNVGVFDEEELKESVSIALVDLESELPGILLKYREICGEQDFGASTVPVPVSSVNKEALQIVEKIVGDVFNQNVSLIGRDFPLEMPVGVEKPEMLGTDRLLTAFAAFQVVNRAVIVADFGSATTIDVVNDSGIFLGGVIMPGLAMAAKSLNEFTSSLPLIMPKVPESEMSYGINTEQAINNGVYFSTVGALREVVERYATELGFWPQVIATGGFANMIAQRSDVIENVAPCLCLNGLFIAYSRWRQAQDSPEDYLQDD